LYINKYIIFFSILIDEQAEVSLCLRLKKIKMVEIAALFEFDRKNMVVK
tara:strand:+ start:790 stop:936 length:147 start_codon:yes stop_codon:yes gene_type:complete